MSDRCIFLSLKYSVGLDLPKKQEVPLATNCSEVLEAPMNEGFVRGLGDRRVREIGGSMA